MHQGACFNKRPDYFAPRGRHRPPPWCGFISQNEIIHGQGRRIDVLQYDKAICIQVDLCISAHRGEQILQGGKIGQIKGGNIHLIPVFKISDGVSVVE